MNNLPFETYSNLTTEPYKGTLTNLLNENTYVFLPHYLGSGTRMNTTEIYRNSSESANWIKIIIDNIIKIELNENDIKDIMNNRLVYNIITTNYKLKLGFRLLHRFENKPVELSLIEYTPLGVKESDIDVTIQKKLIPRPPVYPKSFLG